MNIKDITEGDPTKQGNAVCPQCGKRVLIDNYFGDPPACSCCKVPYRHEYPQPDYH